METSCSRFTAAEGGARLAAMAGMRNTLAVEYSSFISTRLLHEEAYKIRGPFHEGRERSVYVTLPSRVRCVAYELSILTDLAVSTGEQYDDVEDWTQEVETKEVLVCTSSVLQRLLEDAVISMDRINVLIIDSCHLIYVDGCLQYIMKLYKDCDKQNQPRILALTYPLFGSNRKEVDDEENDTEDKVEIAGENEKQDSSEIALPGKDMDKEDVDVYKNQDDFALYERMEWKIEELERELCCQMDLAEDIDGGKRLLASTTKPKELIIEYGTRPPAEALSEAYVDLDQFMRDTVQDALDFIYEHRHDPTEIYGDELYEEFKGIPDPTVDPKGIFEQFLYILDQLGPYAADKAAFSLLAKVEKLKIKIPYERHFLLLCLSTTVFVKIRCYADFVFSKCATDWEKIEKFSTPKVLRLGEILQKFQPPECIIIPDCTRKDNGNRKAIGNDSESVSIGKVREGTKAINAEAETVNKEIGAVDSKAYNDNVIVSDSTGKDVAGEVDTKAINAEAETTDDIEVIDRKADNDSVIKSDSIRRDVAGKSDKDQAETVTKEIKAIDSKADSDIVLESGSPRKDEDDRKAINDDGIGSTFDNDTVIKSDSPRKGVAREGDETAIKDDGIGNPPDSDTVIKSDNPRKGVAREGDETAIKDDEIGSKSDGDVVIKSDSPKKDVASEGDETAISDDESDATAAVLSDDVEIRTNKGNSTVDEKLDEESLTVNAPDQGKHCSNYVSEDPELTNEKNLPNSLTISEVDKDNDEATDKLQALEPQTDNEVDGVPKDSDSSLQCDAKSKMLDDIDLEVKVNTSEADLKDIGVRTDKSAKIESVTVKSDKVFSAQIGFNHSSTAANQRANKDGLMNKGTVSRRTGRPRPQRTRGPPPASPDALCGIVYVNQPIMAKILFMLVADMCRHGRGLQHVCAQYVCGEGGAAGEPRDTQRCGRQQEDVLKKFRMHECNLLLATSALEEGIDLPRCNLVLRWDTPISYRSYTLCRGRARAARACAALLGPDSSATETLLHHVAIYRELDQIITRKCGCGIQDEPPPSEEEHANNYTTLIKAYTPNDKHVTNDNDNINASSIIDPDISKVEDDRSISQSDDTPCDNKEESCDNERGSPNCKFYDVIKNTGERTRNSVEDAPLVIVGRTEKEVRPICKFFEAIQNSGGKRNQNTVEERGSADDDDDISEADDDVGKDDRPNCKFFEAIERSGARHAQNTAKDSALADDNAGEAQTDLCNPIRNEIDSGLAQLENEIETFEEQTIAAVTQTEGVTMPETVKERQLIYEDRIKHCGSDKFDGDDTSLSSPTGDGGNGKVTSVSSSKVTADVASVDLNSAIALINRYCGKLPSDTFTRLAPQWRTEQVQLQSAQGPQDAYICTLRLPLNCPVKYNIVGHPMPTKVLARRMVALQTCRILHMSGELDNQLMPIGKENFKAAELETNMTGSSNDDSSDPNDMARPGTTKRRQYYYKRTAWAFTDCQPIVDTDDCEIYPTTDESTPNTEPAAKPIKTGSKRNMLYAIVSKLWCALPERYNTRGRRLHAPQHARQALGLLMARDEPDSLQIPAFPVYTRSGEVRVAVEYVPDADVRVCPRRARLIRRFMRFVFSAVLRVRRRGMKLQSDGSTHNNYYVVPTVKSTREDGTTKIDVDWAFLELIYQHTEEKKLCELEKPNLWRSEGENAPAKADKGKVTANPLLKEGETFFFDAEKYREAVVTPWYRNQDQPQFFLVAEICSNLTPDSAFPSASHTSFRRYYSSKYNVTLTQPDQPLLDVDHTSARLNLLTPRYVNRKGVALPVSSERTRRAKRDRLDQKQILVPELCTVHPFAAPLWFATVALPCVLYRINALLIADEIRRAVAIDVGLGIPKIDEKTFPGFQWPPLDFGWSLAEVLNADSEKGDQKKEGDVIPEEDKERESTDKEEKEKSPIAEGVEQDTKEKTINEILQEKEAESVSENGFEIGTWTNEMASSIPQSACDDMMEPLPSNLTFCTSLSGGANWCDPVDKPKNQFNPTRTFSMADSDCSFTSSDFDTDESDLESEGSEEEKEASGLYCGKNGNGLGVRIEYKTSREAEAVEVRRAGGGPRGGPGGSRGAGGGGDRARHRLLLAAGDPPTEYIEKFHRAVAGHKQDIISRGHLIRHDQAVGEVLPDPAKDHRPQIPRDQLDILKIFPYGSDELTLTNGQITLESIEKNKRKLLCDLKKSLPVEKIKELACFSMKDVDIDSPHYVNEKVANVGFDTSANYTEKIQNLRGDDFRPYYEDSKCHIGKEFDFDYQPKLEGHPGPSPSVILQALTMSNANDGINLERLETIGDSFLKFAITAYLYCAHPTVHEGKLSHMRSKQVSNLNLYRLGRHKRLGARMIASKFEPHDNWLPPCHKAPHTLHPRTAAESQDQSLHSADTPMEGAGAGCFIPYNLITQHSIPDKSIADCVEALIGAYLLECGPRGALLFMSWLGIRVLPRHDVPLPDDHPYVKASNNIETQKSPPPSPKREPEAAASSSESSSSEAEELEPPELEELAPAGWSWPRRAVGSLRPRRQNGRWLQPVFGELKAPPSPLLRYIEDPEGELDQMLSGYEALERTLQYRFKDRSLLLQALTHASHHRNRLTDCYQRLEFLGDAILDYLITRHLYEDPRRHSPGALTDLRSALVNNTIFATLAARHGFHKYFRYMSPGLNEVLTNYVKIQEENGHSISEEHYLIQEDELEQAEDVEVPKALGDLFESIAGAIFLDSGMSLGAVWKSYVNLMGAELEAFSAAAPKSPVRELLEAEPDTAKFGKPERLADGRRVRVCVEVFGRGQFKGIGRNYRIAKGTAARCALRHLRIHRAR